MALRLYRLVRLNVGQLVTDNGLQADEAQEASTTCRAAFVRNDHKELGEFEPSPGVTCRSLQFRSTYGRTTTVRLNGGARCEASDKGMRPAWDLQGNLNLLQEAKDGPGRAHWAAGRVVENGEAPFRVKGRVEQLWNNHLRDSTKWWDVRNKKLHSKSPDTKEILLVDSWDTSKWVVHALRRNAPSEAIVGGRRETGSYCHAKIRGEDAVCLVLSERDQFSWTAKISEYARCGQGRQALRIYDEMRQSGLSPSSHTFMAVLKACSTLQDLESAKRVHAEIVQSGLELDLHVGTMLIEVYVKVGSPVDAKRVFDKLPQRDVVSWTAMIHGHVQMGNSQVALELYSQMQLEGVAPNDQTFLGALKACSSLAAMDGRKEAGGRRRRKQRCLEQVRDIHSQIMKRGSELSVLVGTMLVDVYAKCGSMEDAKCVFEKMPHRNVVSWTAMIMGYAQMKQGEMALKLYAQMQQEGVVPNERTFVGALKACGILVAGEEENEADVKQRCLEQVRAIHSHVVKAGHELVVFVGTMLVDVYAKCGNLKDARLLFDKMRHRDVVSWNAMILGYARMGNGDVALELYATMQQEGMAPNDRTFVAALKACAVVAGLEKGQEIHAQISRIQHMANDLFVATALLDMYSKCGSMENALQVFDGLRTRDIVMWNALIAGYALQGEIESVFESFQRMRQEGIQPNGTTFLSILSVCSHGGLVSKGLKYFESMPIDFGITPTLHHYTCVLDLLGRAGQVDKVMDMVKTMPLQADSVVWQTVLCACRKWVDVELGRQAFDAAVRLDKNDAAAHVLMSNIYEAAHMWDDAKEIHKEIDAMVVETGLWKQPGRSWWTDMGGHVHAFLVEDREQPGSQEIYLLLQDLFLKMEEGYELHINAQGAAVDGRKGGRALTAGEMSIQ